MNSAELPAGVIRHNVSVATQDINIAYLEAGAESPAEEVILLVHGWPTSSYLYRNMMPGLAKHYRVIALDLPGFGESDKDPAASYSFRYHADIIQAFVEQLGVKQVHLAVHDLGGPIGLWWAMQNPSVVASYAILDTIVYEDFSWAVKLFVGMTFLPGVRSWLASASGLAFAMRFGIYNKELLSDAVLAEYQAPFKNKAARQALLRSAGRLHIKGFVELGGNVKTISQPVCLIYAENDKILPEVATTMRRLNSDIAHAELHSVPECGHFLQEEKPEEVATIMSGFYRNL